jgi:glycosyltransferase involved in cell wall biosynthesis
MKLSSHSPLVSILIPCFNAEAWIAQAIQSALDQSWPHKEVIVVDDGSTDGSLQIIRDFGAAIRWETGPNRGGNAARNRLCELAAGEWLQYLDADDYLQEHKIEQQLRELPATSTIDAAFSPAVMETWSAGCKIDQHLQPIPEPHDPWILLARWYLPQTGCVLWRKAAVIAVGGWKPDQPCCQEHELYVRMLMAGQKFYYCPTPGAVYRQWSEETVCKRDKPEVHRRRLEIEQRAEDWLREQGELTPARLWAINQARFETARSVWKYDREAARAIIRSIQISEPGFIPGGQAAPRGYQTAYRILGFPAAEHLASLKRKWAQRIGSPGRIENAAMIQTTDN